MTTFLTFLVIGIVVGSIYALSAVGLVVTYNTSGVFNFAHGGVGMLAAFSYWQLSVAWHWPKLVALIAVVLVGAPLFGVVIERTLMRRLRGQPLEVQLATTVGLFVLVIGIANQLWNPTATTRTLPRFFAGHQISLFSVNVEVHEILVVGLAVVIAVGLRYFFVSSRMGIAMRAVVDNPALAAMNGARPHRVAQVAWAMGSAFAALAGILLAPLQTLDIILLTLAIVNAFTAAVFGRLRSIPLTVVGAVVMGEVTTFAVGYLPVSGFLSKLQTAIPMLLLFGVLVVLRQDRVRSGRLSGLHSPRIPSRSRTLITLAGMTAAAVGVSGAMGSIALERGARGFIMALILLSLVLLVGYGGQVSLAQFTFVGIGAFAMGKFGASGSISGLVLAMVLSAIAGVAVAAPTLRLRGLYLALATLAFAQAMDGVFFPQVLGAYGEGLRVPRPTLLGLDATSDRSFFILAVTIFALAAFLLLELRRGRWGRKLAALNDSPQACATLGVNIQYAKLAVFGLSAAMAGLGGALYGGQQRIVTGDDFAMLGSLNLLLLLLIGGRNTVTGALLGGLMLTTGFPVIQDHFPSLGNIQFLLTGLGAVTIGRKPNGIAGDLAEAGERIRALREKVVRRPPTAGVQLLEEDLRVSASA